ncbi:MAG: UDP-3-O-(3-hydroxymyristoyl)glucosamine N-acyltransferase [Pseudomonadota bacterium]
MTTTPTHTVGEIAASLGLQALGDADLRVTRLDEPASAGPDSLAMATNPKYAAALSAGQARAAMLWDGADWQALGLAAAICPPRPRHAMSGVTGMFDPAWRAGSGIHPTAHIEDTADVAEDAVIGAFCHIAAGARLGAGAVLGAHVTIGPGARIGAGATLRDGVRILHGVTAGDNLVVQPGAVIGADGFSFVTPEPSNAETVRASLGTDTQGAEPDQAWARIHSLGGVVIGDNVEIGANTCIDAGTIRATRIGSGTKIDNLCQIGHNVVTGEDCLICGHAGIAGSTVLGRNVVMGGRAATVDNIVVGDNVVLGANAFVMSNVPAGRAMLGYPATQMSQQIETYKALRRLPRLLRDVAALKKSGSKDPGQ